jgi:hypothetical protein
VLDELLREEHQMRRKVRHGIYGESERTGAGGAT